MTRLDKHLQAVHKVRPGTVQYKVHLKSARPFIGLQAEMEKIIDRMVRDDENNDHSDTPPPPKIARVTAPPPQDEPEVQEEDEDNANEASSSSSSSSSSASDNEETLRALPNRNVQFYTATTYESDRHKWLCGFVRYLGLPDCGHKKIQNRIQHASQVCHILEALDPDNDTITIIA